MTTDPAALRELLDEAIAALRQAAIALDDLQSAPFSTADEQLAVIEVQLSDKADALEDAADGLPDPGELPIVSIGDAGDVVEGQGAVFPVTLDRASASVVTVECDTFDVTALAGADYEAKTGVVTFQPGETYAEIGVATLDNNVDDPDERMFRVILSHPLGAEIGMREGFASILDDDLPEEPGPDDGPLPAGRLALQEPASPFTQPVIFDKGQMRDAALFAGVLVSHRTDDKHQGFFGGESSEAAAQAAGVFGTRPDGTVEAVHMSPFTAIPSSPQFPHGKATFMLWRFAAGSPQLLQINDTIITGPMPATRAKWDGRAVIGAKFWKSDPAKPIAPVDLLNGEMRTFAIYDASADPAEVASVYRNRPEWKAALAAPVTPPGGGGGGPVDPPPVEPPVEPPVTPPGDGLLPVDNTAVQVALTTGTALGAFVGFGWGAGGWDHPGDAYVANMKALTTDLGASFRVLRLWTAENDGFAAVYKKCHDAFAARSPNPIVLATGFLWRGKNNPEKFADGIARSVSQGIKITHVGLQNEPDGHPDNAINEDLVGLTDAYLRVRARLDALGLAHIKSIGFEWAHFGTSGGANEVSKLLAAGMIPGTVMAGGGHCYSDCPRPSIRDPWGSKGASLWSTETGNLGLPNCWARSISALTHGAAVEVVHIGYGSADQSLVLTGGTKAPWYGGYQLLGTTLKVGTVWRTITSGDRPSGMNADSAKNMVRSPGSSPRLQAACGLMPDGKWWLAACNTTQGTGVSSPYVNACFPAAQQQATVRIAELAGRNGTFVVTTLGSAARSVALVDGYVRLPTLAPGGLMVAVGSV